MNENLNLVEILKDCPSRTSLYSPVYGYVELVSVSLVEGAKYPIEIIGALYGTKFGITKDGRIYEDFQGECMLFPSKDQRDWSKFKVKKPKFDPKTLQPFDKVLVRDGYKERWLCRFFSYMVDGVPVYKYATIGSTFIYCIPYNDETKHLVNTTDEAPEYYRYWED